MKTAYIQKHEKYYKWKLFAKNGRFLAESDVYRTKFHCISAVKLYIKKPIQIIDQVKDRRRRG